jgi:O-antigen ligase
MMASATAFPDLCRRLADVSLIGLAFVVPLVVSPFSTDAAVPKDTLFRMLAALAAAGFAGERFVPSRERRIPLGMDLAALAALLGLAFFSLVRTRFHPLAAEGLLHLLSGAAVFVVLLDADRATRIGRACVAAWLLAASLAALYAIAQASGLDFLRWAGATDEANRVRSTFGHHAFAAMFLGASVVLAVASLGASRSIPGKVASALAGLLSLAALLLTHGRAGYLGCAAGLLALAVARWRRREGRIAGVAVLLLAAALAAVPIWRVRLAEGLDPRSPPVEVRLLLWKDSIRAASAHPILGSGIGLYDSAVSAVESEQTLRAVPPGRFVIGHAHLEFLEVLVELGIAGLLAFALFCIAALARPLVRGRGLDPLAAGLAAAALAVLVTNFFDVNLRTAAGAAPFYLALGLARGRSR